MRKRAAVDLWALMVTGGFFLGLADAGLTEKADGQ